MGGIPDLVKVQEQYKPQGLIIIGNHCQQVPCATVCALLRSKHVNYTVIDSGRLNGDDSKGIPHAWLINAEGKVVKEGHPGELKQTIDQLVQTEPHWIARGKKLETKDARAISEGLKAGKPFGWALGECESLLKKTDEKVKAEATLLKENLLAEVDRLMTEAQAAEAEDPALAYETYAAVKAAWKKTDQATKAEARLKELDKDKAFQNELKASKLAAQIMELTASLKTSKDKYELDSSANKQTADQIRGGMKQLKSKFGDTKVAAKCEADLKAFGF